jgi:hypothetical protein
MADRPKWRKYTPEFLTVTVGPQSIMTAPLPDLDWALRYGRPEDVRMVAASAIESYLYLVTMCSKEEAWRRIKLIREAMKESTTEEVQDGR